MKFKTSQSGLSLVEMIVVIAISVLVFMAVFSALRYALNLISNSSARMSAMSLVSDRIEYFRSLPYHDVGTVGGPVFGNIPNQNIITLNGIKFYEDVRVEFVLDPADDVAGVDSNGIINDYKKIEIEIEWSIHGASSSVEYTSNIVPVSVETNEGYGALKVEVRDEGTGLPLEGADVRITNDTLSPVIDFTRTTGSSGVVLVAVPAGSDYHASTTMTDYSFDKTYRITGSNPNPSPNSFLVEEALIADRPFRIGELSDIDISVYSDITDVEVAEDFDDLAGIAVSTDVTINATDDTLELTGTPGSYSASGNAQLLQITPASLEQWETAVVIADTPSGTQYNVQFYTGDCSVSCSLVSDSDLPNNSIGLSGRFIDLSDLSVGSYSDLTVQVNLLGDTVETPSIHDVSIYYRSLETTSVGTDIDIRGDKVIGVSPDVYKTDTTVTTDASGEIAMTDVEYDDHTLESSALTPTRVCGDVLVDNDVANVYLSHQASVDSEFELVLENTAANTLRAIVTNDIGVPVPGAEVLLERSGFSETVDTDSCGQAFINNTDGVESDYSVTISRVGYDDYSVTDFAIDGDTRLSALLNDS